MDDQPRPLNIPPEKWEQMKLRRGSINTDQNTIIAASSDIEGSPMILLDQALDGFVASVKTMTAALAGMKSLNLSLTEKAAVNRMQDLLDTAIAPYLADIINDAEVFDAPEGME